MISTIIQKMTPISLEEMSGVKLMNRIDTKFLTTLPVLEQLISGARDDFMVQEADGVRNSSYYTRYYDTPEIRMYQDHQRGKKSRRKIRIRQYIDTGTLPFLEIKDKNNKGRTKKKRVPMDAGEGLPLYESFIRENSEFIAEELSPKIENRFKRITLVNKEKSERITIDTSVEFHNFVSGREVRLPELVIIEWKRDGLSSRSRLKPFLRELRIKESGFSKYVVGMALTDIYVPQNKIKPRLRQIEKILR